MNLSQSSEDKLEQVKRDAERANIVSFRDVPTLRKLITAFEDDLKQSQEAAASNTLETKEKYVRA